MVSSMGAMIAVVKKNMYRHRQVYLLCLMMVMPVLISGHRRLVRNRQTLFVRILFFY